MALRTAKIILRQIDSNLTKEVTITQDGCVPDPIYKFELEPGKKMDAVIIPASGMSIQYPKFVSTKNGAFIEYDMDVLIDYIDEAFTEANGEALKFTFSPNDSEIPREGNIILVQNESGERLSINYTQEGGGSQPTYDFTFEGIGENATFRVQPDTPTLAIPSIVSNKTLSGVTSKVGYTLLSASDWIGTYEGSSYILTANTSSTERVGEVKYKQNESGKIITLVITQEGVVDNTNKVTSLNVDTYDECEALTSQKIEYEATLEKPAKGDIDITVYFDYTNEGGPVKYSYYHTLTKGQKGTGVINISHSHPCKGVTTFSNLRCVISGADIDQFDKSTYTF